MIDLLLINIDIFNINIFHTLHHTQYQYISYFSFHSISIYIIFCILFNINTYHILHNIQYQYVSYFALCILLLTCGETPSHFCKARRQFPAEPPAVLVRTWRGVCREQPWKEAKYKIIKIMVNISLYINYIKGVTNGHTCTLAPT